MMSVNCGIFFIIFQFTVVLIACESLNVSLPLSSHFLNKRAVTKVTLMINPNCRSDLRRLCTNLDSNSDDLSVLECIQTAKGDSIATLTKDCHHELWKATNDLMKKDHLKDILTPACESDLEKEWDSDNLLMIILDRQDSLKSPECRVLVQRIGLVAFSDFRIIAHFTNNCEYDIQQLTCGRIGMDKMTLSQGLTLMCLQQHLDDLVPECKKQVLHLSTVQSENIKFDRQLYLACNMELNKFCPTVTIGLGQAYDCLMQHKFDTMISHQCQEQLLRHQKLIVQDFSVSKGLARACKEDIRNYRCRRLVSDDKGVRLAQILLCLENAMKNGSKVAWDCHKEMAEHRRMLLEDFRLSPEIVSHCSNDILDYCNGLEAGGKTIHCLMEHSRPKRRKDRVSPPCQKALEDLVEKTDAGEDWRVDPFLKDACKPVVDKACQEVKGGEARVMNCLMEKLGSSVMTEACEEALLQIQYFVSRDFKLDAPLYKACHPEAVKLCHAKKAWHDEQSMDPNSGPLVLPCLFRYIYNRQDHRDRQLSMKCVDEVRRVMRQRAMSVELQPQVEYYCMNDLARYCLKEQDPAKGEEMMCLQDHLDSLDPECKKIIHNFTEIQSENIELHPLIMNHCRVIMSHYCEAETQAGSAGDVMECLIDHKNEPEVRSNYKCRSTIEHYQLVSLTDYHFTVKFKEACRLHVARYCPSARTKAKVVECLSEIVRNDTISDSRHRVPRDCRQQLKTQLLQQRENVDFDPKLMEACGMDIAKLCPNVKHENAQVLECLEEKKNNLSAKCHQRVFHIELQDLTDSSTDYALLSTCKPMIRLYCQQYEKAQALPCLKKYKDEVSFDSKCKLLVMRRMIEQSSDYRFNPLLAIGCRMDIDKFCHHIVDHQPRDQELQGKVIKCLKVKFREGKLRSECEVQMANVLREAALDYKLNPLLRNLCQDEINRLCSEKDDGKGGVEECLKVALMKGYITSRACKLEVVGLIEEAKADIHVDPILHKACSLDLKKFCFDIEQGAGRHIQCLLNAMSDHKYLQSDCQKMLQQRVEMFKNADEIKSQPQNVGELFSQVSSSPARRYFMIVTFSFVGMVFILGLFLGRTTRRTIMMKNK